jgi:hypothetical protein
MSNAFDSAMADKEAGKRDHVLMNLSQHFKNGGLKDTLEMTASGDSEAFLKDVTAGLVEAIADAAVRDKDRAVREEAMQVLEHFGHDGTLRAS